MWEEGSLTVSSKAAWRTLWKYPGNWSGTDVNVCGTGRAHNWTLTETPYPTATAAIPTRHHHPSPSTVTLT